MLEQESKNKIAHTISRYKLKCNQLEDEIGVLKSAIYQLSLLPNIHVLNEAKTLKELSSKIEKSLNTIQQQLSINRENQQLRLKEYEEKIKILQTKLEEAECGTEKIKNELSFNKVRINYDSVTGLPNRIGYEDYLLGAFRRWQRGFGNVSLAIADIDQLKRINEEYGNLAGDEILKAAATLFQSSTRAVDFIGRYGHGDFIFIFERTAVHDALKILENLRINLEEGKFYCGDTKIKLTASFGLSSLQHGDNVETVFARVDEARYKAKRMGANKIAVL